MTVNSFRSILWFGAIYCATQGALDSWDEAYEISYLDEYHLSTAQIATAQTLAILPMIFKGFIGTPSDVLRLRKPFVFLGLVISGLMFMSKAAIDANKYFGLYCILLTLRNVGAAIGDGAGDGLAIDADIEALSGTLSAWQGVGRMAGLIVSTGIGAAIAGDGTYEGFTNLLYFLGAWMILSAPVAFLVEEELQPSPSGVKLLKFIDRAVFFLTCGVSAKLRTRRGKGKGKGSGGGSNTNDSSSPIVEDFVTKTTTKTVSMMSSPTSGEADGSVVDPSSVVVPNPLSAAAASSDGAAQGTSGGMQDRRVRNMMLQPKTASSGEEETVGVLGASDVPATPGSESDAGSFSPAPETASAAMEGNHVPSTVVVGKFVANTASGALNMAGAALDRASGASLTAKVASVALQTAGAAIHSAATPGAELSTMDAYRLLWKHVQRTPVAAFLAFMFLGQLAPYIGSFPHVLWLEVKHDFSVGEIGYITVAGAFGNAAGCYVAGYVFDRTKYKRFTLAFFALFAGLPYLAFLPIEGRPAIYAVWIMVAAGYGAIYTVQVSQMRPLADKRVAAVYSGVCMGMLAAAAAAGTVIGALLTPSENPKNVNEFEDCYKGAAVTSVIACIFVPWITTEDPDIVDLKKTIRTEQQVLEGKKLRRRSSFAAWVGRARGIDTKRAKAEIAAEDSELTASLNATLLAAEDGGSPSYSDTPTSPGGPGADAGGGDGVGAAAPAFPTTAFALLPSTATAAPLDQSSAAAVGNLLNARSLAVLRAKGLAVDAAGNVVPAGAARGEAGGGSAIPSMALTGSLPLPTLRKPALGSMKNLLDPVATESPTSVAAQTRKTFRRFFDDTASSGRTMGQSVATGVRRLSSIAFGATPPAPPQ